MVAIRIISKLLNIISKKYFKLKNVLNPLLSKVGENEIGPFRPKP